MAEIIAVSYLFVCSGVLVTLLISNCEMDRRQDFEQKITDEWKKAEKRFEEETTKTREERKKLMHERQRVLAMAEVDRNAAPESSNDHDDNKAIQASSG